MSSRIGYPHIVSTLALVVALVGSSVAVASSVPKLAKNSVASKQIKNGTITGKDIGANAITGANVDESSLGKVPSAVSAGAADRATSAASVDSVQHVTATTPSNAGPVQALHSGPFTVRVGCEDADGVIPYLDIATTADGLIVVSSAGHDTKLAITAGHAPVEFMSGSGDTTKRLDFSLVAHGQFLEATGQLYEFDNICGANLVSLG